MKALVGYLFPPRVPIMAVGISQVLTVLPFVFLAHPERWVRGSLEMLGLSRRLGSSLGDNYNIIPHRAAVSRPCETLPLISGWGCGSCMGYTLQGRGLLHNLPLPLPRRV